MRAGRPTDRGSGITREAHAPAFEDLAAYWRIAAWVEPLRQALASG